MVWNLRSMLTPNPFHYFLIAVVYLLMFGMMMN